MLPCTKETSFSMGCGSCLLLSNKFVTGFKQQIPHHVHPDIEDTKWVFCAQIGVSLRLSSIQMVGDNLLS